MVDDAVKSPFVDGDIVEFHYQKTPYYRGIHVDGMWGGVTPRGILAVSFFHERQPIPKHARRKVVGSDQNTFVAGQEEPTEVLSGVVRQVETTAYFDLKAAQEFYVWLGSQVAVLENLLGIPAAERVGKPQS